MDLKVAVAPSAREAQARRAQEAEWVQTVRLHRQEPGLWALRQLLQQRLIQSDNSLRRCQLAEVQAVQARAQLYEQLLDELFFRNA
jgi:hypothetical protein